MPRKPNELPTLLYHKVKGVYFIRIRGKTYYLGKDRLKAEAERLRLIAEWHAGGTPPQKSAGRDGEATNLLLIAEVVLAYQTHVKVHYRKPDGRPTSEQTSIKLAVRPLLRLYGGTYARDFDAVRLEAVRREIIKHGCRDDRKEGGGCCRKTTNQNVGRIVRMFQWAAQPERKLVPASVYHELSLVKTMA